MEHREHDDDQDVWRATFGPRPPRPGPLSGVRVVELATYISAPFGTMMLADLGAEVLKVEPLKGDPMRRLGRHPSGTSPLFVSCNRGKTSIFRDLKQPAAQAEVRALLAGADVLVCNWRSSVAERLGLADDDLVASNSRLVRVYVSGFGTGGPLADAPVFDTIIQAQLGFTEVNGDGSTPGLDSSFIVDKTSGVMVCQAALAALAGRELHGSADRVDLAMHDAVAYAHFPDVMANRTFLRDESLPARNPHPGTVRPLATTDGWVVVVPGTAEHVRRALEAVGKPELGDSIVHLRDGLTLTRTLYDALEPVLRTASTAVWIDRFAALDVPIAPCLSIDEHLADAQAAHNDLYRVVEWAGWDDVGPMRHIRYPAVFSGSPLLHPDGGPPRLPD